MGALDVRCPTCGAQVGKGCTSVHARKPCRKPHAQRVSRANGSPRATKAGTRAVAPKKRRRMIHPAEKAKVRARSGNTCEAAPRLPTLACSGRLAFHHLLLPSHH